MSDPVVITIPGAPVPWARAGAQGKRRFTPKRQEGWMTVIRDYGDRAMAGRELIEGPVCLACHFAYVYPKTWSAKKRTGNHWKVSRPDVGNLVKLVEDALNGVVFVDDAQIVMGWGCKCYSDKPHTLITVTPL